MRIFQDFDNILPAARGGVVALGNFDGVHRGHMAVLSEAAKVADEFGVPLGVVVFEPHPREYFVPDAPQFRVSTLASKARQLELAGIDNLYVVSFDKRRAEQLAQDFVLEILVKSLQVVHVVAGYDFRFGKGRSGNADMLRCMAEMEGFGLTIVDAKVDISGTKEGRGEVFSSSRIRDCLREGDVQCAAEKLGHWWQIESMVRTGDQRGRTIGFPTANLVLEGYLEPQYGVYAVRVGLEDDKGGQTRWVDAVANLGCRPTFDKDDVTLEINLFDFDGDLYGKVIQVAFVDFIRPERKFDGLDALKEQIKIDSDAARAILSDPRNAVDRFDQTKEILAKLRAK